jgi:hypothetical protein
VRATSIFGADEIGQRDRLVAVRAGTAGTNATAEDCAIWAALLAEVARLADWALVDGGRAWRAGWGRDERSERLAGAPGSLTAGIRAEATATDRLEAVAADRAGYRHAIVT